MSSSPRDAALDIHHADEEGRSADLRPLDHRYLKVLRVRAAANGLVLLVAALVGEAATPLPFGSLLAPAGLAMLALVLLLPGRQYKRWGFDAGADRLRVARGVLFRADTTVPFGRVQHIDVTQGPLERAWRLGSLTLHTAGTHNASVVLPGLAHEEALAMREAIRAHIRRDTM